MLENTFCHLQGIGIETERKLWGAGLHTWRTVLDAPKLPLSPGRADLFKWGIEKSVASLTGRRADYFYRGLPTPQHWRLFREFRDDVAYLDIETTGMAPPNDHVTTIAIYDGRDVRYYVRGRNLDAFGRDMKDYKLIVTFNGKTFDVPFLRKSLGVRLEQAHIDLRYVLSALGHKGGLKKCEQAFGLDRGELDGVDGFFAVLLWREYKRRRNEKALETLLAYNIADVVNLEALMVRAYNMSLEQTPFSTLHVLPMPEPPELPLEADPAMIERIRRQTRHYKSYKPSR